MAAFLLTGWGRRYSIDSRKATPPRKRHVYILITPPTQPSGLHCV